MNPTDYITDLMRLAYMQGFQDSTDRLNGDTRVNDRTDMALVMEYLGLEDKFDAWLTALPTA